MHAVLHALSITGSMTWEITWALILGFALSAVVQAVVRRSTVVSLLGDDRPRTLAVAAGLGAASSSCSYASVALARSLFRKGANFTAVMAFEIASTNLVVELGVILAPLHGLAVHGRGVRRRPDHDLSGLDLVSDHAGQDSRGAVSQQQPRQTVTVLRAAPVSAGAAWRPGGSRGLATSGPLPGGVGQQAQAVEADDDGGALMPCDSERQRQGCSEVPDDQGGDEHRCDDQVLHHQPAGLA
jgi:hypothetical protein